MDPDKLVATLRAGNPAALQELVELHGDRLLRSAVLLCGNETDAQDLVQDTFVEAARSARRFRGGSTIYTWLHAILLNLTRHYHRSRKKIVYDAELESREMAVASEEPVPSDLEIAGSALTVALRQLSVLHREVLLLRYYEHLKIHEIAAHLGISKGTVKSRLHYAIGELQKRLPAEMNLFSAVGTKERT
jgi:RNA polymerase sigma-70 factor, ECF subfamily